MSPVSQPQARQRIYSKMRIEPEISAAAIVLIGNFNPTIFQPSWMTKHEIFSEAAEEAADIGVIHSEITSFSIESLFSIRVERERFAIERTVAPLVLIADIVCRLFGDLLPHTPIMKLGINRVVHFDVGSTSTRDHIGLLLAPREPWGEWGKLVSSGEGTKHGGLQSLTLVQRSVSDRPAGWIQAKIEPSKVISGGRSGIFMEVNDHYEVGDVSKGQDAREIIDIVRTKFDASIRNSESIVDQIMGLKP